MLNGVNIWTHSKFKVLQNIKILLCLKVNQISRAKERENESENENPRIKTN